jgi:excisionase family DNA binding protein
VLGCAHRVDLTRRHNDRSPEREEYHMAHPEDRLTIAQLCKELGISRSTFYEWRVKGRAPRCIKLPNGQIRIRRAEFERWLESLEEVA